MKANKFNKRKEKKMNLFPNITNIITNKTSK